LFCADSAVVTPCGIKSIPTTPRRHLGGHPSCHQFRLTRPIDPADAGGGFSIRRTIRLMRGSVLSPGGDTGWAGTREPGRTAGGGWGWPRSTSGRRPGGRRAPRRSTSALLTARVERGRQGVGYLEDVVLRPLQVRPPYAPLVALLLPDHVT